MSLPTISEIIQAGSPMQSTTPMGTSFDISQGVSQLFQAAQMKQQADWQRYSAFVGNIQNFMKDAAKIAEVEMAPEDREVVMQKYAEFLTDAKENLSAIANPMSDPAAYASITGKGAETMSLAYKSKGRKIFDAANNAFLKQNPEWNTKANREMLDSSYKTPITEWQPYQLGGPMPAFDIFALAEEMNKKASTPFLEEIIGGPKDPKTGQIGKGDQYIYKTEGTKVDDGKFGEAFEAVWTSQDKYGNVFSDWVKNFVWDALPAEEQKKYTDMGGDPLKNAGLDYMRNLKAQDQLKNTVKENPVWELKTKEAAATQRARISASTRSPGDNTNVNVGSMYDYTIKLSGLTDGGTVKFSELPSPSKDFLQKTFQYEESVEKGLSMQGAGTSMQMQEGFAKRTVRIPDDATVTMQGGLIIVKDKAGNTLRKYDKSGMDNEHSSMVAKGLSNKLDYQAFRPLGTGNPAAPLKTDSISGSGYETIGATSGGAPIYKKKE